MFRHFLQLFRHLDRFAAAPLAVSLVLLLGAANPTAAQPGPADDDWISLFTGENLEGWDVQIVGHELNDNFARTFRVEDGILKVRYDGYDRFDGRYGHIITQEAFSNYRLVVEYRFVGDQVPGAADWALRNNGIMLHSQSAESMTRDQDYPISIEAQLLGGTNSGDRPTANVCTPGTHIVMNGELVTDHCIDSSSDTYHGDRWVRAETIVLADSLITHVVEGDTVLSYSKPQIGGGVVNNYDPAVKEDGKPLTEGHIALQSESHPTDFRTIKLLPLEGCTDPGADNYRSYYEVTDSAACEY